MLPVGALLPTGLVLDGQIRLEVIGAGEDVADAHDIGERGSGLCQRVGDVAEGLLGLLGDILGDRHGFVIEAGGPRHHDPAINDDDARIAHGFLEGQAGRDQAS